MTMHPALLPRLAALPPLWGDPGLPPVVAVIGPPTRSGAIAGCLVRRALDVCLGGGQGDVLLVDHTGLHDGLAQTLGVPSTPYCGALFLPNPAAPGGLRIVGDPGDLDPPFYEWLLAWSDARSRRKHVVLLDHDALPTTPFRAPIPDLLYGARKRQCGLVLTASPARWQSLGREGHNLARVLVLNGDPHAGFGWSVGDPVLAGQLRRLEDEDVLVLDHEREGGGAVCRVDGLAALAPAGDV